MISVNELAPRYENFGLLVAALTASFLVSGISDARIVTLAAGILNILAVVVGFASSEVKVRTPLAATVVLLGSVGSALVYASPAAGLASGLGALAQALMLGVLTAGVVARVVRHTQVTSQTILGAIGAYLLIGQVFAWIYFSLPGLIGSAALEPANSDGLPIYYSYIVLTTLGFGDITPTAAIAQRVTILEALLGQVFLAVLVARLVSAYSRDD